MKKVNKKTIYPIILVIIGVIFGSFIDNIGGYIVNSLNNLTSFSASSSDMSSSYATTSNATESNATNSNSSETTITGDISVPSDNFLILNKFKISDKEAEAGDKVNVDIKFTGAKVANTSVTFRNANNEMFTVDIIYDKNGNYFIVPNSAVTGDYSIKEIMLVGLNSNGTTFTVYYDSDVTDLTQQLTEYEGNIKVNEKAKLNSISLKTTTAKTNDKVYLNYKAETNLTDMKLIFNKVGSSESFTAYVKEISDIPYFIVPTNALPGEYSLTVAYLTTSEGTKMYVNNPSGVSPDTYFDFNTKLTILENTENKQISFNNEDYGNAILSQVYDATNNAKIIINADSNSIISSDIFNSIKGSNKELLINYKDVQYVFEGKDINIIKDINVSMYYDKVIDDKVIGKLINNGTVLTFASNKDLPAKAKVRVRTNQALKESVGTTNIYVYYFDEVKNKFELIQKGITESKDGYYEFNISHTSKYIMTSSKINDALITTGNKVSFQKSTKSYGIILGSVLIIAVALICSAKVVNKNKNKIEEIEIL